MDLQTAIISLVILIFSVVIHEVSHGIIAEQLGDSTARDAGRLTLNPLPHIDPISSILLPGFLIMIGSPIIFGAAKPVPVNFANLRHPKRDMAFVALAGPGSNLLLALVCGLTLRFGLFSLDSIGGGFLLQVVIVNLVLAIFNLIPIPPLDGSKVLAAVGGERFLPILFALERYGYFIIIIFLFTGLVNSILIPVVSFFLKLFVGIGF